MPRLLITLIAASAIALAAPKPVDFQREIRPILSDNCFQCHGPDSGTRMANLRLDLKEPALAAAPKIAKRIAEPMAAKRMPPPYSHKALTPAQIALVTRWIDEGAPWKEHWAYKPPVKPALPPVKNAAWVRTPIDRFILARLEAQGLTPAPAADDRTLLRRAALDLTGLPPTPAEIETYLADKSPNAYEHMLDRYLASPHYGEHRAKYWLDAARYGDTHGIHIDNARDIWPYRDWVIDALNRNQRFDRFTIEQLAGDMLPNATMDQKIATGFQRCNVTTNEGGVIEAEYAEIYAKDRAETTAAVWLGLTVGCATCHDHKFDPISQKDFYALGAFFRNTTQRVLDGNISDTPPVMLVPRKEDRAEWEKVQARLPEIRTAMKARLEAVNPPASFTGAFDPKSELYKPETNGPKLDAERPFSVSVTFVTPKKDQNYTIAAQQGKEPSRGWLLDSSNRQPGFRLISDNGSRIQIRAANTEQLQTDTSYTVTASYDGSRQQSGLLLYVNGREVPIQGRGAQMADLSGSIEAEVPVTFGKQLAPDSITAVHILNRPLTEAESNPTPKTHFALSQDPAYRALADELNTLNATARRITRQGALTQVMSERADSKPTAHTLFRGAYDQPRDLVEAATPSVLPPMTADLPHNRLGLAQWLFKEDHPLTARVTVNRMWQEIFGIGLTKTSDDFGSQGEPPTHPELLDWLAVDFRENSWDLKRFYKQILMSAAYRQSAVFTPEKLAKDPENRLISRGPRFRMDAEMVRDYALKVSGLLSPEIGGPSARPYQPDGVWEAVAMKESNTRIYKKDVGDALYRRSMYTFWKRSAPPASMDIFNAPTRESCTVRRERTNTPLQALVTMNDPQFMEAARVLAERGMQASANFDTRLDLMSTRLLTRPLTPTERKIARKAFGDFQTYYDGHPADAVKLLNTGDKRPDPSLPPAEFAAFTMLANELLNLDEVLNK